MVSYSLSDNFKSRDARVSKNGSKFSHLLTVRAEWADPPSFTISLTVKYPSFFDDSPEDWENVLLESWIKTLKIGLIKIGELLITSSKGLCVDDAQGEGWLGLKLKMNWKTKDVKNLPMQDGRILNFQCKTIYKSTNSNILASSESTSVWSLCSKAVNSKMSENTKSTISP